MEIPWVRSRRRVGIPSGSSNANHALVVVVKEDLSTISASGGVTDTTLALTASSNEKSSMRSLRVHVGSRG